MTRIHGISVILYDKIRIQSDPFGNDIFEEVEITVDNVLVGQPSAEDVINEMNLSGKRLEYTLGIPKGDTHDWENKRIRFWGQDFVSFGSVIQGIEDMIPLAWNKKVKVEKFV